MENSTKNSKLLPEWDLTDLYEGRDDIQLCKDLELAKELSVSFVNTGFSFTVILFLGRLPLFFGFFTTFSSDFFFAIGDLSQNIYEIDFIL